MVLPILIFAVCFGAGFAVALRWLPPLTDEPVGIFAGYAVAILLGAALAVVGLEIYLLAKDLSGLDGFAGGPAPSEAKGVAIGEYVRSGLYESGTLAGLACIIYLLAPRGMPRAMRQRR